MKLQVNKYMQRYFLKEYFSASDRSLKNIVFEKIGYDGYLELVRESLEIIKNTLERTLLQELVDEEEVQALSEMRDSFIKTLNGLQPKRKFSYQENMVYIEHCKIIFEDIINSCPKPERNYRNRVTQLKAEWRQRLPLAQYVRAFVFSPSDGTTVSEI